MNKIIIILFALIIGFFIFFSINSSKKKKSSESKISYFEDNDNEKKKKERIQKSLFDEDSKFLEFSNLTEPEFVLTSELSKEELLQRKKILIEKSKYLADLFPNNSLIPRELTSTEEKIKKENEQKMSQIRNKFLQEVEITKKEKLFYYTNRLKIAEDRIEIFKYTFGKIQNGNFDFDKLDPIFKERYNDLIYIEKAYKEEIKSSEL